MVRHWWKPLYKIWFGFLLLIFIIFSPLLFWIEPFWIGFIFWWLKPLYDRIILNFFSHALFGEQPNFWQSLFSLRNTRLLMGLLTWWRFDLARSFNLPVWQLEGARGKTAIKRMNLLRKLYHDYDKGIWLTLICIHFEWMLVFSLFGLLYMFTPTNYNLEFVQIIFLGENYWVEILSLIFSLLAIGIIEPLYVAAGFALYLNRRTHLEAWDIELAFRRIADELNQK
jgi:hypothetical protein